MGLIDSRGSVGLESLDPELHLPKLEEVAGRWSASCLRTSAFERVSCGEASDSTTCGRTRTGRSRRSPCP